MTRTRATALALVNWKGVFYERYLLDRHVTALEGANGAGKTTVMIAAYVVLLPDMSRLRFTNLGETGATAGDKGIWGRLGEPERPSYAVLELELAGHERLIIGVHLERRSEPSVEPTPFLITNVGPELRLQQLLLLSQTEHEIVPQLKELRANVAALGAHFEAFQSTREYFAALFERGITPLRLASDEDRNKLNEMLRTSMMGGISRALTSELRNFVLKEETGLSDTLSRMRGNLEACRRTRAEVTEARRLEHEISGVYEAGQNMFAAALLGTRKEHEEAAQRVAAARRVSEEQAARVRELESSAAELLARKQTLSERVRHADAAVQRTRERIVAIERSRGIKQRLEELARELPELDARVAAARSAQEQVADARRRARAERSRTQDAYERAARGIADVRRGLDELHRRAHELRTAQNKLAELRALLGDPELEVGAVDAVRAQIRSDLSQLDSARARKDRELESANVRGQEYAQALAALRALSPEADAKSAYAEGRAVLLRRTELGVAAQALGEVVTEAERLESLGKRQHAARSRAEAVGLRFEAGQAVTVIQDRLFELEAAQREAEERSRAEQASAVELRAEASRLSEAVRELQARALSWTSAQDRLLRLTQQESLVSVDAAGLVELRTRLTQERDAGQHERKVTADQRQQLLAELSALESGGAAAPADLLDIREELDAELLAERFESVDLELAARVQARIGPLAEALIVEDPAAAAKKLAERPRTRSTVLLIDARAELDLQNWQAELGGSGRDVVVQEPYGLRITRIPEHPTLGRTARERRSMQLRAALADCEAKTERLDERLRQIQGVLRECELLLVDPALLGSSDPRLEERALSAELPRVQEREQERAASAAAALAKRDALRLESETIRSLLVDAHLLDAPDYRVKAEQLRERIRTLRDARSQLAATEAAAAQLRDLLEALREPPLEAARLEQLRQEVRHMDQSRERLYLAVQAADEVARYAHALAWADNLETSNEQSELLPALERQLDAAKAAVAGAEVSAETAEVAWEQATAELQQAEANRAALVAHVERVQKELEQAGGSDGLDASAEAAEAEVERVEKELAAAQEDEREFAARVAVHQERIEQARRIAGEVLRRVEQEQAAAEPSEREWRALCDAATAKRVLQATSPAALHVPRNNSIALWAEARSRRDVLLDRLGSARGEDAKAGIEAALAGGDSGSAYLEAWLVAREWLRRRLPTQVADTDEPLVALEKLRDRLGVLEERLDRQEHDLRGASEDVARSIEVQLRRARAQVRRLNQHLEGIRFGSIQAIRVQMTRVERMDAILKALREGSAQELLFQPGLPIEDALNEIFKRFGGGRTGGQKLLDYREYAELAVEIQRQSKSEWETANPSRLSTGEAIGVGAALMMVVLTEWERDATLLRPKTGGGALRFLFLDEANRLSQDNLGVLFELCQTLDLQLLIAAPEVARAEGNTTYRLVRRLAEDGREEVIVSGRRTVVAEGDAAIKEPNVAEPDTELPEKPPEPATLDLFGSLPDAGAT